MTPEEIHAVLSASKARVEKRHGWFGVGKLKGAYQKMSFGEGDTNTLKDKPDTFFGKLKPFAARKLHQGKMAVMDAGTLGAASRNEKKERYGIRVSDNPHDTLDITDLDAGLHEFIRSAVNHYWLAKKAATELYPGQVKLWERDGKALSEDRIAPRLDKSVTTLEFERRSRRYGDFRHDLRKARVYLHACQTLSAFCYGEIGLARGQELAPDGKLFRRAFDALPGVSSNLYLSGGATRVPSGALCTRTQNCQSYLETRIQAHRSGLNMTAWDPQDARTSFQESALERMNALDEPGFAKKLHHHYRRELREADRREKIVVGGGELSEAASIVASPVIGIGIAVLGNTVSPVKMVLKKIGGQFFKLLLRAVGADRETDAEVLLDNPEALALTINSAERLDQSELQSFGRKIDERIVAAARHLNDAYDHLDALVKLRKSKTARNQVAPVPVDVVPLSADAARSPNLESDEADLFYEVAHDLEKGMRYLNQVTIFECALDQALQSLEEADRANYHQLDDEYEAPRHD